MEPRYASCAVVGASGLLLNTSSGPDIDSHEAVIRVNTAPAGGPWRQIAGSRTTWRVLSMDAYSGMPQYPRRWLAPPLGRGLHASLDGIPTQPLLAIACQWPYDGRCMPRRMKQIFGLNATPAHLIHPDALAELHRQHFALTRHQKVMNTGFIALAVAKLLCRNVHVYGYGDGQCFAPCYHYYECSNPERWFFKASRSATNGYHDFMAHARALRDMADRGAITWHRPTCHDPS